MASLQQQTAKQQGFYKIQSAAAVLLFAFVLSVCLLQGRVAMPSLVKLDTHKAALLPELVNISSIARGRTISIKVGVFAPEQRPADQLFIEFDPTVDARFSDNQIILPVVAAPFAVSEEIPFYLHVIGGCSSTLMPSGLATDLAAYKLDAQRRCEDVVQRLPASQWKNNDYVFADAASFRAGFPGMIKACATCQGVASITGVRRFKAVALSAVVQMLPGVGLLDIDAQGLDVALLLSLGNLVARVRQVKIECQEGSYIYHHVLAGRPVPANSCTLAERFLSDHGFACRHEINNCACSEYNLFCNNTRL